MHLSGHLTLLLSLILVVCMTKSGSGQVALSEIKSLDRIDADSAHSTDFRNLDYVEPCSYDCGSTVKTDCPCLGNCLRHLKSSYNCRRRELSSLGFKNDSILGTILNPDRDRLLPFLGKQARELGYDIPLPFGVGGNIAYMDQPMDIEQISLSVADGPLLPLTEIPPFRIKSRDTNYSMRYDVWLLPFFNVYGLIGHTRGSAVGNVTVSGVVGLPDDSVIPVRIDYDGPTYGGGCTGAIGYKNLFAVVDWNYTSTDLEGIDTGIAARTIAPRVGLNFDTTSFWVGGFYLNVDKELSSSLDVGGVPVGLLVNLDVAADWNFIYGCRWVPSPNLELVLEHGFSRRNQVVGAVALRF